MGFPCGSAGKKSAYNEGDLGLIPGLGRCPGEGKGYPLQYSGLENSIDCIVHQRRQWHPTPVLLPGKSHGWRSLVGCSAWGHEESDTTERLPFHFSLSRIGEGNGNPLQCACLENPRDGGAWWAAIYGVTRSRTRLKRLSSSSMSCTTRVLSPWKITFLYRENL